jgi:hypothetical protein
MNRIHNFRSGENGCTSAELKSFGFAKGAKPLDDKSRNGALSTGLESLL